MLQGQVAIITGAGRGIGREIARLFAAEGAKLVLVGRNAAPLESLRDELARVTGAVEIVVGDVAEEITATQSVAAAEERLGGLDILVNNAGMAIHRPLPDVTVAEFDQVMNTNMRGTFLFSRAVVPSFLRQGRGTIVNIGSGAATRGIASESVYCASKFAQRGFTLALDQELRPRNIRVSLILPGNVDTEFHELAWGKANPEKHANDLESEDVARATLFAVTQGPRSRVVELALRPMLDAL